jgi:pyruvate,water dikinase
MNYIRWFDEVGKADLGLVGGKGANLGEMTRAGLPVPPGFCITSQAYGEFLSQNQLDTLIRDTLNEMTLDDLDQVEAGVRQIQAAIMAAAAPSEIVEQVAEGYRRLAGATGPVAVRSSATAEDQAGASFAGQMETYLNVRGVPALLEHLKLCWASLWSSRVVAYIANQRLDHARVSMSVVVQAMIPAQVSGVMFSANPVTGNRGEVVINASWGLGEAIVSGLVSPDTITARKDDGRIICSQAGAKQVQVVYAADGGTQELPVAPELRAALALSQQQVLELVQLGKRIEAYYGAPQDIEWGFADGHWYLLQSRPITTLVKPETQYPPGEFNRTMFVEVFPEALSPIFLSVLRTMFKDMLDYTFRSLGFEPPQGMQAIGVFYNQPYFNRDYIAAAFRPLPTAVREKLIDQFVNPLGTREKSAGVHLSWHYLGLLYHSLRFMVRFPKQLPDLLRAYKADVARASEFPLQSADDETICRRINQLTFEHASRLINNDFLMIAVSGRLYRMLGALLRHTYQADTEETVAKLISGVTGNVTMETNTRLWDLAQQARRSPEVAAALRNGSPAQARNLLEQFPDGCQFLQALDIFMKEFGHREAHFDILYPTWCEDPQPVYFFLRSYLDADENQSPYRQQERLIRERQKLSEMAARDLSRSLVGRLALAPAFKWLLHHTQLHTRERDTMHFEMTRLFPPLRRMALELGRRWVERGLLDQPEDVFFLEIEEMSAIGAGSSPAKDVISQRREAYQRNMRQRSPEIIRDGKDIFTRDDSKPHMTGAGLQGIAGSPGRVTGLSRVISGPQDFHKLRKGEILVAPITNPVWTPLFSVASGVITEVGGILSHGAIVAREYGIPAVMSVSGATHLLQDGQHVTVDGSKGMVYLGEEM